MTFLGNGLGSWGVHAVLEQKELLVEVVYGGLYAPAVLPAEGEGAGNADGSEGIQAVCILDYLPFYGRRGFCAVLAERNTVDGLADALYGIGLDAVFLKEGPGVGIVGGVEELVVISIVKQCGKGNDSPVAFRLGVCDAHGKGVHPQRVIGIVASGIASEELSDVFLGLFNELVVHGHMYVTGLPLRSRGVLQGRPSALYPKAKAPVTVSFSSRPMVFR